MSNSEIIQHLLAQVKNDDSTAFRKLYELFFPKISRYTEYFLKRTCQCEDVVSEVFLELWKYRKKLPDVKNLDGYIYTITKNKALQIINRDKKENHDSLELVQLTLSSGNESPEEIQITKELDDIINSEINKLPGRCKLIFLMAREDGYKYRQIAEILSISEKTVNAQMVTAIKKLTAGLLKYFSG